MARWAAPAPESGTHRVRRGRAAPPSRPVAAALVTVAVAVAVAMAMAVAVALGGAPARAASSPPPGTRTAHPAATPAPNTRAAALIEESGGQSLYARNADTELPIASTTKLMTALVVLHHARLRQTFAAPAYYPAPAESQIGLAPGERMSVHDLLIALLLPSANDAAEDLAYNVGHGSVGRFVAMMNARAHELGLSHTHYTTPVGLDAPGNYSSAHDLLVLARYLLRTEPYFASVVRQRRAVLRTGSHVRAVVNLNALVRHYAWVNGVKTGHTLDAGYVLVASGTRDGMTLIGVVLGTASEAARDAAALSLLDYGFANFRMRTPLHAGQILARPAVSGKPGTRARLIAASSYSHVFARSSRVRLRVQAPAELTGPLPNHAAVGSVHVLAGRRVVARIPLLLTAELPKVRPKTSSKSVVVLSVTLSGLVVAVGAAIGLTMFWREWHRG